MVPDLGVLTLPVLGLLLAVGYGLWSGPAIVIEPIVVPPAIEQTGYSSQVVTRDLADEMRRIGLFADASRREVQVDFDMADTSYNALTDHFGVTHLVDAARQTVGLVPYYFTGDMVSRGAEVELRLRAYPWRGAVREFSHRAPATDVHAAIVAASFDMLGVIDPYLAALYIRRVEETAGSADFAQTFEAISRAFATTPPSDQHLVHELWARTLLLAGRAEDALRVAQATVALKPDFAGGHLAHAQALGGLGRHAESLPVLLRAIALRPRDGAIRIAYAQALDACGRKADAIAALAEAARLVPEEAAVHHALGLELMEAGRQAEAVTALREAIARTDRESRYFDDYRAALLAAHSPR